jgi:DNA-binding response OmpR family regulator
MTTTMMSEEVVAPRETAALHVLIVDDEPTIREACAKVAQTSGMHATTVATAEEATEVIENTAIDIVLTDLMLPQTSGSNC